MIIWHNLKLDGKDGDYIRLGKAVSNFNKKIRESQQEENKLYLPQFVNYNNLKNKITTRSELNRIINSLKRFQKEGAEKIVENQAGQKMTAWERNENIIATRTASRSINRQIRELNLPKYGGFSRVQMGSEEYRQLNNTLKSFKNLNRLKGYEYNRLKERINKYAESDLKMKRSIVYRENYINEMKKYSHFDNYNLLMEKLNSIKNPIKFYEFVSQNEFAGDLTWQSDQYYTQEAFNYYLEDLGIEIETDSISS